MAAGHRPVDGGVSSALIERFDPLNCIQLDLGFAPCLDREIVVGRLISECPSFVPCSMLSDEPLMCHEAISGYCF